MRLINRETGQEPTLEKRRALRRRARQIITNPYSSPEQMEWAAMVDPEFFMNEYLFDGKVNHERWRI